MQLGLKLDVLVIGMHGVADHAFKGLQHSKENDYFNYLNSIRNPEAVTAATLLVKKNLFTKVEGFDQKNLKIAFNDVDLCLKIHQICKVQNLITTSKLIHHESKTRKTNDKKEGIYLKNKYQIKDYSGYKNV
jgi:GT2 family glycosyltransferase